MTKAAEVHDVDAGVSGLRRRREAGLTEKLGIVGGGGGIVAGMTSDHCWTLAVQGHKGTRKTHCARPRVCT